MICVISIDPSFGNAASITTALKQKTDVIAVFKKKDPKRVWKTCDAIYGYENIPKVDEYIIVSGGTLQEVESKISGKIKVVITDSRYRSATDEIDDIIKKVHAEVFCMPDLWHICKLKKKAFYQPFNLSWVKIRKTEQITLCHSPYSDRKCKMKGSQQIIEVFEKMKQKYKIDYQIIKGVDWYKCIQLKSKSHIFVDQYVHQGDYIGGIGKSGLEGMLLKCLTISSGKVVETDIPSAPVVWCNEKLEEVVEKYIFDEGLRNETAKKQYKWARKYTSFDYVSNRLLGAC